MKQNYIELLFTQQQPQSHYIIKTQKSALVKPHVKSHNLLVNKTANLLQFEVIISKFGFSSVWTSMCANNYMHKVTFWGT